jgi:hypothetical protein
LESSWSKAFEAATMNSPSDPFLSFPTTGELLLYVEKQAGTITRAVIPQTAVLSLEAPGRPPVSVPGVALLFELSNGETACLRRADADAILNDGILNRKHVTISFVA